MAGKEDQIKTEIAVDGEQEYKKACKEIDASLKAIASEMKVVSATFEGNADSIEAMTAKQDVLNKRLEEQKKKVAEAEAALKKYQDAGQGTSEAAKKMETNLNYARAAMIKTENEIRNLDAGLEEARDQVGKNVRLRRHLHGYQRQQGIFEQVVIQGTQKLGNHQGQETFGFQQHKFFLSQISKTKA